MSEASVTSPSDDRSGFDAVVMCDLPDIDVVLNAYSKAGIKYTVLSLGDFEYVLIGERRDIRFMEGGRFMDWHESMLETVLMHHSYLEFENGKLVSYTNS